MSSDGTDAGLRSILDGPPAPPPPARRPKALPALLFLLTCWTTWQVGGWMFAVALMLILTAHELGHYWQARRYGVPTSFPYFLPIPAFVSPFGTLGAVLAMRPGEARARGLFDIAVSGPLAGLAPSVIFTVWGMLLAEPLPVEAVDRPALGSSFFFSRLQAMLLEMPPDHSVLHHPLVYAGWVGLFVTALNLLPVGQLDGGHILYALAPRWAYRVSLAVVALAWIWMLWEGYWLWILMLILVSTLGLRHPPVEPGEPLDLFRRVLGWATLIVALLIFTPKPILF